MSPGKTNTSNSSLKPVTPESVKVFMLIELALNIFFTYWIINEYQYNIYFRSYVDNMILAHLTTYTAALGLAIGLAGSAIAATLHRNLKHAKLRLEKITETKLKPTMQKVLEKIPELSTATVTTTPSSSQPIIPSTNLVPPKTEALTNTLSNNSDTMPILPIKPVEETKPQ